MSRFNRGLFTSTKQTWKTPEALYSALNEEFHFDFDPCPTKPTFDGLTCEWGQSNFVNPPYKDILVWIQKAITEWKKRKTVVMLVFSRTDTRWWHEYAMQATETRFVRGRIRFSGYKWNAPMASALLIFKGGCGACLDSAQ